MGTIARQAFGFVAAMLLSGCGAVLDSSLAKQESDAPPEPWTTPVPRAECGPDDRVETALQGQVPQVDRLSGRSREGYTCNLELIGTVADHEGAGWQHAWYDDCAYYGTGRLMPGGSVGQGIPNQVVRDSPPRPGQTRPGTWVIDVTDSTNPVVSEVLTTYGMLDPWESLKVNEQRVLLGAVEQGGPALDLYDIAEDCRHPKLVANPDLAGVRGHAGEFTADGLTYYGSYLPVGYIYPVDITDPTDAKVLTTYDPPDGSTHDLSFNADGTRAYLAQSGTANSTNGLLIIDTTQVQERRENPEISIVSFFATNGSTSQETEPVFINGVPMILYSDEGGHGAARLIDISDETAPKLVSRLMLEVHAASAAETAEERNSGFFGYEGHYCGVDDPLEVTVVACSYFQSGLRIFDVRDPYKPKEIAYYNPPAAYGYYSGSNYNRTGQGEAADWTSANVRVLLDRGEFWFTSQENGFQVVRFTNGVWPPQ